MSHKHKCPQCGIDYICNDVLCLSVETQAPPMKRTCAVCGLKPQTAGWISLHERVKRLEIENAELRKLLGREE